MDELRKNSLNNLEDTLNVNFINIELLDVALTHSSYVNHKRNKKFNERLEFLGDAVLELVISDYLFKHFSKKDEGELTKIRSLIVCESSLYDIAKIWGLGKYINMSKGEELTGGRDRVSILSDCVEAIIAAVYIDKGLDYVKKFILTHFKGNIGKAVNHEIILDYKTKLQESVQQKGDVSIQYSLDNFEGPPHRRKFYISVFVDGIEFGKGEGFSKKEAEQHAAKKALERMNVIDG